MGTHLQASKMHLAGVHMKLGNEDMSTKTVPGFNTTKEVQHLPAVGQNLRDHLILPRLCITPPQKNIRKALNTVQGSYLIQEQIYTPSSVISHEEIRKGKCLRMNFF